MFVPNIQDSACLITANFLLHSVVPLASREASGLQDFWGLGVMFCDYYFLFSDQYDFKQIKAAAFPTVNSDLLNSGLIYFQKNISLQCLHETICSSLLNSG